MARSYDIDNWYNDIPEVPDEDAEGCSDYDEYDDKKEQMWLDSLEGK